MVESLSYEQVVTSSILVYRIIYNHYYYFWTSLSFVGEAATTEAAFVTHTFVKIGFEIIVSLVARSMSAGLAQSLHLVTVYGMGGMLNLPISCSSFVALFNTPRLCLVIGKTREGIRKEERRDNIIFFFK